MTNPSIRIHDMETGEIVDRKMTDAEYDDYLKMLDEEAIKNQKLADEQAAKSLLLSRLGITEDEAKLLLS